MNNGDISKTARNNLCPKHIFKIAWTLLMGINISKKIFKCALTDDSYILQYYKLIFRCLIQLQTYTAFPIVLLYIFKEIYYKSLLTKLFVANHVFAIFLCFNAFLCVSCICIACYCISFADNLHLLEEI